MADIRVSDVKQMTDTELDAWLAEHVMGYRWEFSSDPAASAQLRERMIELGWEWQLLGMTDGFDARFYRPSSVNVTAVKRSTECRAVAEAAFAALEGK